MKPAKSENDDDETKLKPLSIIKHSKALILYGIKNKKMQYNKSIFLLLEKCFAFSRDLCLF